MGILTITDNTASHPFSRTAPYPEAQQASVSSLKTNITSVDGDTAVDTSMNTILVDCTTAAVGLTLPDATDVKGIEYTIKKTDSGANAVTITPDGTQTINGAANYSLATQHEFVSIKSDGSNWIVIDAYSASAGTFTTAEITTATITTANCTTVDADTVIVDGFKPKVVAKTGAYTATVADHTILCSAASAGWTLTLPAASGKSGLIYVVKKTDNNANAITIDANASETIDGATTYALNAQYKTVTIQCDGTGWHIISAYSAA